MIKNLHSFIFHLQIYYRKVVLQSAYLVVTFSLKFLPIESVLISQEIPPLSLFSLSFLGIFLCFLLYSHTHGNRAAESHQL